MHTLFQQMQGNDYIALEPRNFFALLETCVYMAQYAP